MLHFQLLMALTGVFNPLYRIGADAMMADLIPPEKRAEAYSLLRTSNNVGVALGPAVGGFIASASYTIAFIIAAAGMITYSLLVSFRAQETLPKHSHAASAGALELLKGYKKIGGDRRFVAFVFSYTLTQVCAALVWILLGMYANKHFQIQENLYGFIPMTNALMVVLFQVFVTRWTKRYPALWMLALGAFFYAIGTGSVALGHRLLGFLAEHGDHDHRRADLHPHRHHPGGQPGPGRHARPLHEHLRPDLERGPGHRPVIRRAVER